MSLQTLAALASLGVELERVPVPVDTELGSLLQQADLSVARRDRVAELMDPLVRPWRDRYGYAAQDLVVLHPETPGLDASLARFEQAHTHRDDEVRYVIEGEGLFGFFDADGVEHKVRVAPGDFVRVPAGVEHRFTLLASRRIKALRLFTDAAGWAAVYTGRPVAALEV